MGISAEDNKEEKFVWRTCEREVDLYRSSGTNEAGPLHDASLYMPLHETIVIRASTRNKPLSGPRSLHIGAKLHRGTKPCD